MRKFLAVLLMGVIVTTCGCLDQITQSNREADKKADIPCSCTSRGGQKPAGPVDSKVTPNVQAK
jgi:hypothetical protein